MTKEELKRYISEAVDALDPVDLELLFPPDNQPDLYSVVEELTGLKGAFNKLSGSNLKLNHEIHSLVEQVGMQQEQQENFLLSLKEEAVEEPPPLDAELKAVLLKLLEMDELIQLAEISYTELPKPGWFNKNDFKVSLASWKKGFDITLDRWKKLLQSSSLYKTGLVGETFDPEIHEAVAVKHKNDLANNTILETEQAGFLYKGEVVKLAKVVVNKVKAPKVSPKTEMEVVRDDTKEVVETSEDIAVKPKRKRKKKKGSGGRRKKRNRKRKR